MELADRVYIVTGASSGIGAETAVMLAGKGACITINYARNQAGAEETAERCRAAGGKTLIVQADVAADPDCRRVVDETMAEWGRIDGLVNNDPSPYRHLYVILLILLRLPVPSILPKRDCPPSLFSRLSNPTLLPVRTSNGAQKGRVGGGGGGGRRRGEGGGGGEGGG